MLKIPILLLLTFYDLNGVQAQNCRPAGTWCGDTDMCCGGCCIHNTCINTYKDCTTIENPCYHHPCPGDAECRLYQPNCQGCEIQWMCVFLPQENNQQQQQQQQSANYYKISDDDDEMVKNNHGNLIVYDIYIVNLLLLINVALLL